VSDPVNSTVQPRWQRHFAQYWWLWGLILPLLGAAFGYWWLNRLSPVERQFVGVWKATSQFQGTAYLQYVVINSDRTSDSWSLDNQGVPVGNSGWIWKADATEFAVRTRTSFDWRSPIRRASWDPYLILQMTENHVQLQNILGTQITWERVPELPEPFATAREKWMKEGNLD
jgi:hypothetical protein